MKHTIKGRRWNYPALMTSIVLPAVFAVLPGIRKRYGFITFSVPSLALMGGLWLWQQRLEKRTV